jgi:hypothetical protein
MEPPDPRTAEQPGAIARGRVAPAPPRLRSPILDAGSFDLLALDPNRRRIEIPPLGEAVGILLWSLVPAVPLAASVGWQPAVIGAAAGLLLRTLNRFAARSGFQFADGFLQFQSDEGPALRVREDDDVRWHWSGLPVTDGRGGSTRS